MIQWGIRRLFWSIMLGRILSEWRGFSYFHYVEWRPLLEFVLYRNIWECSRETVWDCRGHCRNQIGLRLKSACAVEHFLLRTYIVRRISIQVLNLKLFLQSTLKVSVLSSIHFQNNKSSISNYSVIPSLYWCCLCLFQNAFNSWILIYKGLVWGTDTPLCAKWSMSIMARFRCFGKLFCTVLCSLCCRDMEPKQKHFSS